MIHEVRNWILRSIDLLPYSVYMSSILAAEKKDENEPSYEKVFDTIKLLIQNKKSNKSSNIFNTRTDLNIKSLIDQNVFMSSIKNNLAGLLSNKDIPIDQIKSANILVGIGLDKSIFTPDAIKSIKDAISDLLKQLNTDSGVINFIAAANHWDPKDENLISIVEEMTGKVAGVIQSIGQNSDNLSDQMEGVLSELIKRIPAGRIDTDIRKKIVGKTRYSSEQAVDKIVGTIRTLIDRIPEFTADELKSEVVTQNADYAKLVAFLNSLARTVPQNKEDVLRILTQLQQHGFTTNSFDNWLNGIFSALGKLKAKAQNPYNQKLNFKTSIQAVKSTADAFNEKVQSEQIEAENGIIIAKIIVACGIVCEICKDFENKQIMDAINSTGGENNNNEPATPNIFSYGRYFIIDDKNRTFTERNDKSISIKPTYDFIVDVLRKAWSRIPYNVLSDELDEYMRDFNSSIKSMTTTSSGNVIDTASIEAFDSLQIPEDYEDSFLNFVANKISGLFGKESGTDEMDIYSANMKWKHALGLTGRFLFNFGKAALFFVNNGGYESYKQCLKYLMDLPEQYLKNSAIQPEEAKEIYRRIHYDHKLLAAFIRLTKFLDVKVPINTSNGQNNQQQTTMRIGAIKRPFFLIISNNIRVGKYASDTILDVIDAYKTMITDPKILNVFARISKSVSWANRDGGFNFRAIFSGLRNQDVRATLKFVDDITKNTGRDINKVKSVIHKYYNEYEQTYDYMEEKDENGNYKPVKRLGPTPGFSDNPNRDSPTILLRKLLQIYAVGGAGEASSWNMQYININDFFNKMGIKSTANSGTNTNANTGGEATNNASGS